MPPRLPGPRFKTRRALPDRNNPVVVAPGGTVQQAVHARSTCPPVLANGGEDPVGLLLGGCEPAGAGGLEAGDDHGIVPVVVQAEEAQVGQGAEGGSTQVGHLHHPVNRDNYKTTDRSRPRSRECGIRES